MITPDDITVTHEQLDDSSLRSVAVWKDEDGIENELVSTIHWTEDNIPNNWAKEGNSIANRMKDMIISKTGSLTKTRKANVKTLFTVAGHSVRFGKVKYAETVDAPGVVFGHTGVDVGKDENGKVSLIARRRDSKERFFGGALGRTAMFLTVNKDD